VCQLAEEQTEDHNGQKRLKDGPRGADRGLLVADFQVTPHEEMQQFAIVPKFAQVEVKPTARRGDRRVDRQGFPAAILCLLFHS
jgi:hypothetical protein